MGNAVDFVISAENLGKLLDFGFSDEDSEALKRATPKEVDERCVRHDEGRATSDNLGSQLMYVVTNKLKLLEYEGVDVLLKVSIV